MKGLESIENADVKSLRPGDGIYLGYGWDFIVGVVHRANATDLTHMTQQSGVRVMLNAHGWTYRLKDSRQ